MKMRMSIVKLVVLSLFLSTPAFSAALTLSNFGFEDGLLGWTVMVVTRCGSKYVMPDGVGQTYASVVSSHQGDDRDAPVTYTPTEGSSFLELNTSGSGKDALMVAVYRTFTASKGDTLSGYAAFDAQVGKGCFSIFEAGSVFVNLCKLYSTNVLEVGRHGDESWTEWDWTALCDGKYTLCYLLSNPLKCDHTSYAMFDAAPVPIPSPLLILGSGLIGLIGLRRRTSRTQGLDNA